MKKELTADQERQVRRVFDQFVDMRGDAAALPDSAPTYIMATVGTYVHEPAEIDLFLRLMFQYVAERARAAGEAAGAAKERATNPALRSFGEAAAAIRTAERDAARAAAAAVFDRVAATGANPLYAFAEALKALA